MMKKTRYPIFLCLTWAIFSFLLFMWNSGKLKESIASAVTLKEDQAIPLAASPFGEDTGIANLKRIVYKNSKIRVDATNMNNGYLMIAYTGKSSFVKLQFTGPGGQAYTYSLVPNKGYETFPITCGSGTYHLTVYENINKNQYSSIMSRDFKVKLTDEYLPFLYPNQYVNYDKDSESSSIAARLARDTSSEADFVESAYSYVTDNIHYDTRAAQSVSYGYLPDVDKTLKSGKGICFDYAALLTAMLRSQGIPTRLEIGYTGNIYHAWVRAYVKKSGWMNDDAHADGGSWKLLDPTFAANSHESSNILKYIGNGDNYRMKYTY